MVPYPEIALVLSTLAFGTALFTMGRVLSQRVGLGLTAAVILGVIACIFLSLWIPYPSIAPIP